MASFFGRGEEQDRFRAVLTDLVQTGGRDEGYVILVHGFGGIGKSTLLRRYGGIAAEGAPARGGRSGLELLIAAVDWENEQRLRAADFVSDEGPPIWVVLDRVYGAVREAAASSRRDRTAVKKAFAPFRVQITKVPELAKEVQQALPSGEDEKLTSAADIEAVLQLARPGRRPIWRRPSARRSGRGTGCKRCGRSRPCGARRATRGQATSARASAGGGLPARAGPGGGTGGHVCPLPAGGEQAIAAHRRVAGYL